MRVCYTNVDGYALATCKLGSWWVPCWGEGASKSDWKKMEWKDKVCKNKSMGYILYWLKPENQVPKEECEPIYRERNHPRYSGGG